MHAAGAAVPTPGVDCDAPVVRLNASKSPNILLSKSSGAASDNDGGTALDTTTRNSRRVPYSASESLCVSDLVQSTNIATFAHVITKVRCMDT